MITAAQMRAARALLGIDQRRLAELSGVSLPTIPRMEASAGPVSYTHLDVYKRQGGDRRRPERHPRHRHRRAKSCGDKKGLPDDRAHDEAPFPGIEGDAGRISEIRIARAMWQARYMHRNGKTFAECVDAGDRTRRSLSLIHI